MKIMEFFSTGAQACWPAQMAKCDWSAGTWLGEMLQTNKLQEIAGAGTLVPMLVDGNQLVAFCTFAPLDDIQPTDLSPWIGFVYTFPAYRGQHYAGMLLDWCESMATIMGKEYIHISTTHVGLYEKYGYTFYQTMKDIEGEESRVYRKALQEEGPDKEARLARGGKWKAEVVAAAKKDLDMTAMCGFSCRHCFLGEWCGGCRSFFNCCSYGTLCEHHLCPNIKCCREKGLDGCYKCDELMACTKGFYSNGKDGNAAKAQALFVRKYGKEAFLAVHEKLHQKYDFSKTQEILGYDVAEGLRILEANQ